MTQRIVEIVGEDFRAQQSGVSAALNYAVGALILHDSSRGASPFDGVDVERLFSAIEMLADRQNLEVSPFVAQWSPAVESPGRPREWPPFVARDIKSALDSMFSGGGRVGADLERVLKELFASQGAIVETGEIYRDLQVEMIRALGKVTRVKLGVDYLSPLLTLATNTAPFTVASLNYDLTIEELCRSMDVKYATGMAEWDNNGDWRWGDSDLRLLKLHGSINWDVKTENTGSPFFPVKSVTTVEEAGTAEHPLVVFGQRGKIRAGGPFLAMLRQLDLALDAANALLVVGYSFRDDHINVAISRWLSRNPKSVIVVVDPAERLSPSRQELSWRLNPSDHFRRRAQNPNPPRRLFVVKKLAGQGLASLLSQGSEG